MAIKQKKCKPYTMSLDIELMDKLDEFCEKERRSRTSAVELAVERYLKAEGVIKEGDNNGQDSSSI